MSACIQWKWKELRTVRIQWQKRCPNFCDYLLKQKTVGADLLKVWNSNVNIMDIVSFYQRCNSYKFPSCILKRQRSYQHCFPVKRHADWTLLVSVASDVGYKLKEKPPKESHHNEEIFMDSLTGCHVSEKEQKGLEYINPWNAPNWEVPRTVSFSKSELPCMLYLDLFFEKNYAIGIFVY